MKTELYNADCLQKLKELPENSVDSVVTDPPYGLVSIQKRFGKENSAPAKFGDDGSFSRLSKGFMGKEWDGSGIEYSVELWSEVLRVLKPGGHLLSFGGTRTYHRMACAIEDAGFEIRDMVEWVYGSGFPKSLDIGKAIDKIGHGKRETLNAMGDGLNNRCNVCGKPFFSGNPCQCDRTYKAQTPDAQQWSGYGTSLKPSHEPICMARKPLAEKTVASNVLKYDTGAINIDGCRVETADTWYRSNENRGKTFHVGEYDQRGNTESNSAGRFPANLIHDGSEEVVREFPYSTSGARTKDYPTKNKSNSIGVFHKSTSRWNADEGSAARFYYCAKASKSERGENNGHPTVKPIALMRYLCRMVTPKGGTVLDPFMGSGSTGIAAKKEAFNFIGIEKEKEYFNIAEARINASKEIIIDAVQQTLL